MGLFQSTCGMGARRARNMEMFNDNMGNTNPPQRVRSLPQEGQEQLVVPRNVISLGSPINAAAWNIKYHSLCHHTWTVEKVMLRVNMQDNGLMYVGLDLTSVPNFPVIHEVWHVSLAYKGNFGTGDEFYPAFHNFMMKCRMHIMSSGPWKMRLVAASSQASYFLHPHYELHELCRMLQGFLPDMEPHELHLTIQQSAHAVMSIGI